MNKKVIPHCDTCKQSTHYKSHLDRGTVDILKAIAKHIKKKGINIVHPRKELETKSLTSNQVGNLSKPRVHGLIARAGVSGNYCLTRKGVDFLKGKEVPRTALVRKATSQSPIMNDGYVFPKKGKGMVTIYDFVDDWDEYWKVDGYEIKEGQVHYELPK